MVQVKWPWYRSSGPGILVGQGIIMVLTGVGRVGNSGKSEKRHPDPEIVGTKNSNWEFYSFGAEKLKS